VGVERNLASRGHPHPTTLASLREAKAVDLPLAGGGITESVEPPANTRPQWEREPGESAAGSSAQATSTSGPAVDVASLPPVESITAESDIRAFLAPGIPPELTRAALRRAWVADPKIREFIGLSENSWDFNAAGAIPGFGPLEMTDELRRRITQFVGRNIVPEAADASPATATAAPERPAAIEPPAESDAGNGEVSMPQPPASPAEPLQSDVTSPDRSAQGEPTQVAVQCEPQPRDRIGVAAKGPHGGALPK
jgi:hypothetical protein